MIGPQKQTPPSRSVGGGVETLGQMLSIKQSSDTDLAGIGPLGIQPFGKDARGGLGLAKHEPQQPLDGRAVFGRIQFF